MTKWFAWHPIKINETGKWVWLRTVYRGRRYSFPRPRQDGYPVVPVIGYWVYSDEYHV